MALRLVATSLWYAVSSLICNLTILYSEMGGEDNQGTLDPGKDSIT